MNRYTENEDTYSRATDEIVADCGKIFNDIHLKNQSEHFRQKVIDAYKTKYDFLYSLNMKGVTRKNQTVGERRIKNTHTNALKVALRNWIDFRKSTEPDFEAWYVREGLPRLKRVEIFSKAMLEKNLSFEEALEFCGFPQLSNKEKEMIRRKVPLHRREEIKRGETIYQREEAVVADDLSSIDHEETNEVGPRYIDLEPEVQTPLPENMTTLDQAKQWYDEAVRRQEEATKDVNNAKAMLARIIYDQQAKLNKVCKDVFGEKELL